MTQPRPPQVANDPDGLSEHDCRDLIANVSDWVWAVSPAGVFTHSNPAVTSILGYTPAEVIGRTLFDFMTPEDKAALVEKAGSLIEQRLPFEGLENTKRRRDGTRVVLESSGYPVFGEDGTLRGYRGISRDVSARKATEQALIRSEKTYRTLVDAMPQSVFLKDLDGRLISCNRSFATMAGLPVEALQGRTMEELHPSDLVEHFRRQDQRVLASGAMEEFDDSFRRGDHHYTLHIVKVPVRDETGAITGLLGIAWDITEKHRAEEALRETQMRYRALLQNASDAILVGDTDGHFIDANRRAEELFGYSRDELLRMRIPDLHAPENRANMDAAFRMMNETGASLFEHRMRRKDGTTIDVEASGTRIPFGDSFIYLGNFRDISQRKRIEQELGLYRDRLEQMVEERTRELRVMNRELEAFSYSVSHDLRAPLRAINGFSEVLREELGGALSEDARFCIERIRHSTLRMADLIDGLLNLSRVTRRELQPVRVDLSAMAQEVADRLREAEPGRAVAFHIARSLSTVGDPTLLRVLLENLVGNAWKFTAGCPAARIEFGCEERGDRPVFFVRDNGAGFDMQYAHKLFRPFARLHAGDEFDGTGIGLATVRRIVERHRGEVWAEGGIGQGACVYFFLGSSDL